SPATAMIASAASAAASRKNACEILRTTGVALALGTFDSLAHFG
ncbi:MAG: hypothetical protein K0S96_1491, partial [Geminicoccaceae bacterium]|nr:hypothetical protein [Geminicoccaceae bacterium]